MFDPKALDDVPGGANLGRAEFGFCQRVLRGKILELYVVPRQQRDTKYSYLFRHQGATEITFGGLRPNIWRVGFCEEVKGPFVDVYVPDDNSWLEVVKFSDSFDVRFA